MAIFSSRAEMNEVKTWLRSVSGGITDYWLGLTDAAVEGDWSTWVNGKRLAADLVDPSAWNPGEPNNFNNEDCAMMPVASSGGWNDVDCSRNSGGCLCRTASSLAGGHSMLSATSRVWWTITILVVCWVEHHVTRSHHCVMARTVCAPMKYTR
jgi:Lectin C-type domain